MGWFIVLDGVRVSIGGPILAGGWAHTLAPVKMFRRLLAVALQGSMLPLAEKRSPATMPAGLSSSSFTSSDHERDVAG
jgi:hypothetical protein